MEYWEEMKKIEKERKKQQRLEEHRIKLEAFAIITMAKIMFFVILGVLAFVGVIAILWFKGWI